MVLEIVNSISVWLIQFNPALVIFAVAFFISLVSAVINKRVMSTPKAKELKEKMKTTEQLRKEIMDAQKMGDSGKVESLTKKSLEIQSKYMSEYTKLMFKPMIISIFLVILILPLLQSTYKDNIVASVPSIIPFAGGRELNWLWWYIILSLSLSIVIRRILGD